MPKTSFNVEKIICLYKKNETKNKKFFNNSSRVSPNRSLCPLILEDSKFVALLKTALTFNHKNNDASVSKTDLKF